MNTIEIWYTVLGGWYQGYAVDEQGNIIAQHVSSSEDWLRRDMSNKEAYSTTYPEGYSLHFKGERK